MSLKGKTTRPTPESVRLNIVQIPKEIRELHCTVTLSTDIFFMNNIPFFLTLSRNIIFATITHLIDRQSTMIFKAFKSIFQYYLQRGFQITGVTGDGEFAPLQADMVELPSAPRLNLASTNEHEPFVERKIRVIKERFHLSLATVSSYSKNDDDLYGFLRGQTPKLLSSKRRNI